MSIDARVRLFTGLAALSLLATGCGGGGSRAVPAAGTGNAASAGRVTVTILSHSTAQSVARRPQYVSPSTQSAAISVNGAAPTIINLTTSSPNCSGSPLACTVTVTAPVGTDTFTIALYDAQNGTGSKLSTASTTLAVVAGLNTLNVVENGVVASVNVSLNPPSVTSGASAALQVNLSAYDPDNNLIVGGTYSDASGNALTITLTDTDTSGATTITPSSVTGASANITLNYTGAVIPAPTISATVSGGSFSGTVTSTTLIIGVNQQLYIANRNGPSVLTFPVSGPYGNAAPNRNIVGGNTQLVSPIGLALDNAGNIYVNETDGGSTVAVFSSAANGNVAPATTFTTTFNVVGSEGIAVNSSGNVYVSSYLSQLIDVFPAAPSGNVTPTAVISGANTLLSDPVGMTLSPTNLYVTDYAGNAVYIYAANANGNVAPTATISGGNTQLNHPGEVVLDYTGRIIVANTGTTCCSSGFVLVFASGASGNATPVAVISGANTGLMDPSGVAVDTSGNIWVSDAAANAIYRFASTANGNVAPTATYSGALTTLSDPQSLQLR